MYNAAERLGETERPHNLIQVILAKGGQVKYFIITLFLPFTFLFKNPLAPTIQSSVGAPDSPESSHIENVFRRYTGLYERYPYSGDPQCPEQLNVQIVSLEEDDHGNPPHKELWFSVAGSNITFGQFSFSEIPIGDGVNTYRIIILNESHLSVELMKLQDPLMTRWSARIENRHFGEIWLFLRRWGREEEQPDLNCTYER